MAKIISNGKKEFPELVQGSSDSVEPVWNFVKSEPKGNKKIYPNGDVFQGEFDSETGRPFYGIIIFVNGNIYEGPIHYSWPSQIEEETKELIDQQISVESDNFEDDYCDYDYEYETCEQDIKPTNEGVMAYPDGKTFVGVFYFGKEW
uniref:Uncharacterized protein n=1 Tax=viral metagenome TaxID=1070528 RepID=A0A6C0JGU9_9ZZZZ